MFRTLYVFAHLAAFAKSTRPRSITGCPGGEGRAAGRLTSAAVYGRILVGTDGSDTAERAVERAVAVAKATGSVLTILAAGEPGRALPIAEAAAARHAGSGVQIEVRASEADPATALVEAAEAEDAGLLVVGSRGMTGAGRLLGSVPNKVSHHAPCHLLIVHTT